MGVGPGMTTPQSVTAEARATLTAALTARLNPLEWQVFPTRPPGELPTPCVYVDVAARRAADADGAPVTVVTFPVVAIVDGADDEQMLELDNVGDAIWDVALELSAVPQYATPDDVDVGGPRLRYLVTSIDVIVEYLTLCREEAA